MLFVVICVVDESEDVLNKRGEVKFRFLSWGNRVVSQDATRDKKVLI